MALDSLHRVVCHLAPGNAHVPHTGWVHPHPSVRGSGHLCLPRDPGPKACGLGAKAKNMKAIIWVGILLIVLGGLALAYQGFTYTHREKVLDIGPIHATADKHDHVSIPPILGGLALAGGVVLLFVGAKKSS